MLKNQYEILQGDSYHRSTLQQVELETLALKEQDRNKVAKKGIGTGDVEET